MKNPAGLGAVGLLVACVTTAPIQPATSDPPARRAAPPLDLDGPLAIELGEGTRFEATLEAQDATPARAAMFFPLPPSFDYQQVDATLSAIASGKGLPVRVIDDLSPHRRPVWTVGPMPASSLKVLARFSFQTHARHLVNGTAVSPSVLGPREREIYTRSTVTHPWKEPAFLAWMDGKGLRRQSSESAVRFAYRAMEKFAGHFTYKVDAWDAGLGHTQLAIAGIGECNAISSIYTSVLRANGIPSRRVTGRTLPNGGSHLKAEFFAEGVGSIPVEVTGAASSKDARRMPDYFGNDPGLLFVIMQDADLMLPVAEPRGARVVPYRVGALSSLWLIDASRRGRSLQQAWKIRKLPD